MPHRAELAPVDDDGLGQIGHPDAFRSLHDFLFSVVSRSRDVIVIADETGRIVFATGAIEAVTGWEASDLLGTDGL
ncbi:MAG: hypothetical protein QOF59_1615, partial [Actinomycetota bacterium]|nr:hypothetical protein [Actinomycetota bacterium]